jgi:pyruvate dehydrogenase E1 component
MAHDIDPVETQEWLEALFSVLKEEGPERAKYLINELVSKARDSGCSVMDTLKTPYTNTISVSKGAKIPGDPHLEQRIRALIRWNAAVIVVRAGKSDPDLGGHIGTFASSATLYDVGFNHFWRAPTAEHGGDLLYIQGHSSPGIYARSYLEGVLSESQISRFRQEVEKGGLSSYPHPWLMPDYWQFPTVSMGLGALQAIYQARFMRYLEAQSLIKTSDRKVWCFCGDGEMDEPESMGALSLAARDNLDNLVFVVNCNLQRLDGPVRGNGKIIQELESGFKGAGWNVIKVIWGNLWDPLFEKDKTGLLAKRMEEAIDGDYQNYKARGGAYTREHFFGKYPELKELVQDMSDEDIWNLNRGGHDVHKVYAAYHAATHHVGQPTVILAKTVKGYGLGDASEAKNAVHNTKKMTGAELKKFKDRFNIPIPDDQVEEAPFYRPSEDSPEIQYLRNCRAKLGGSLPSRRVEADETLTIPPLSAFDAQLKSTGERKISTTTAFVRLLTTLCKDKAIGKRIVPIVPDEARTFGMEGLFRQLGIYSAVGQLYQPVDSEQVMYYKEAKDGQILEEGITEAGSFSSWIAAATSYSVHNTTMIPFYIFYSMFGFQRIGDLAWAAGDSRARGFLIGATAGRTTLNGEGLQHEDGHSHIMANTIPNCLSYDPTFSYELAVIIQEGLRRMVANKESIFYYITTMNENYEHPEMPADSADGILKGMYCLKKVGDASFKHRVQLLGSGTILREVIAAADLLANDFQIASDIWSVTSFNLLARDGQDIERWNQLHPMEPKQVPFITSCLEKTKGPIIASTDYIKQFADQVRAFVPRRYSVLGTDGFGRSDTRAQLRQFFEVDRYYIAYTAIKALADEGVLKMERVVEAMKKYNINPDKPNPRTV